MPFAVPLGLLYSTSTASLSTVCILMLGHFGLTFHYTILVWHSTTTFWSSILYCLIPSSAKPNFELLTVYGYKFNSVVEIDFSVKNYNISSQWYATVFPPNSNFFTNFLEGPDLKHTKSKVCSKLKWYMLQSCWQFWPLWIIIMVNITYQTFS